MKKVIAIVGLILLIAIIADRGYVFAESPSEKNILLKLDQIQNTLYNQVIPKLDQCCPQCPECPECPEAGVPRTGQTTLRSPFDDGALQKGVPWPEPRFTDNPDGTVTDNLTRLIWLREANCWGLLSWHDALVKCNDLKSGWCGLEDGSSAGDWRLPNRNELLSLLDIEVSGTSGLLLPDGNPFTNVQVVHYWSSSTAMYNLPAAAYYVDIGDGTSGYEHKASTMNGVWPVRSANP